MYELCLKRDFIARHFLVGGDWGRENGVHAHHFAVEWTLAGGQLDEHGYLVDLLVLEARLDAVVEGFRDALLNDEPALAGLNPSVERFARLFSDRLMPAVLASDPEGRITRSTVRLWEHERAWASWTEFRP